MLAWADQPPARFVDQTLATSNGKGAPESSTIHLIWQGYNYSKGHKWVSDLQLKFLQEILVVTASAIHTLFRDVPYLETQTP